jgi:hypothetical protein
MSVQVRNKGGVIWRHFLLSSFQLFGVKVIKT